MKNSILIIKKSSGVQPQQMELVGDLSITAESGAAYSLVDSATGIYPEGVVLQKENEALQVIVNGEVLLVINDYFEEGKDVSFDEFGAHLSATDFIAAQEDSASLDSPVWDAEIDTVVTLDDKEGEIDATLPSDMRPQEDSIAQGGAMDANLKEQPEEQPVPDNQGVEGEMGWGWYAAAALGLGALAGGGGSGGGSSSSGSASSSTTISSAAGIFFSTVQIDLYDASGNLISSVEHDYSTGDYVYTGSYSGPMLVEIIDINDTATDYTDETTGEAKSLGTSLRAMTTTDGSTDKAISVTPLTELATQIAGVTSENRAVTEDNVAVNSKVATLFGLDDILDKPAVVTEDTSSADEASIKYGQALAILSGADSEAGNASAAETIATIADSLKEANSDTDAPLKLTSEVADILTKGLEAFNDGPTGRDNAISTTFTFSSVPVLVDGDGNVLKAINAEKIDSTIEVKIKGVSADGVVTLTVGENTTDYTVLAGDVADGYAYVPISSDWFSAADGNYDVVVTVNEVDSTTTIKVDTTAPGAPTFKLHQDTGESDSDGITSDTTVDVTLADGVTNWQYSLDGGSTWISRTSGASFELKSETTYAAGDIQVKQIDKAGNESEVTSNTSVIETLETLAPDLSVTDTGSSDSDGITSNTTVSVTFDEGVDLASWQYSLNAGSTWTDGTGTSFELTANKTYQADTIQVKQIDTEGNEELSALSSKVVTDTTATTPVIFLATDSGQSQSDGITNDTTYRVKLAKDTESWEYSVDSGANWVKGSGTSFELAENQTYAIGSIQVRQTDVAGNVTIEPKSNSMVITTDTISPDAPSASLHDDTGASDEDGITNDTTVDVTLADDAVSWQYSLDGGTTWSASQAASVTTFELADNTTYQAGDLQIRQYDAAGNVSAVDSNSDQAVTTDSLVSEPELTFSLTSNELTSTTVTVTLADDVASWEYSLDGGATWNEGSGERFSLEPLTSYDANAIQVRQTDIAGNVSDIAINESLETDVAIDPPSFELASDTGVSDEDFITSSATVNVTLLGGDEGAVSWNYSVDGGETWSADQDISTTSFDLAENTTYQSGDILVTQTDAEGNTSAFAANDSAVIVDSLVDAPEFGLNADTGSSVSDGITNDLVINVDLADDVSTWQYSLDNGANWLDGEATSFELDANTSYAAGAIQVKQIDLAGNESLAYQNSSTITTDTLPLDAPTFSLNSDSGSSAVDNITNDPTINVVLSEDAVAWQYSTDAGLTWQDGTETSFELAADTSYLAGDIQVQQIDVAGNISASASNEDTIEIDTSAITPTFALNLDSGLSDSDGVTNDVVVNFDSNGETSAQSWSYSLDNGSTWIEGTGSSFSLADNTTYAIGAIQVKQVDTAGNESLAGSNDSVIVTDSIPLDAPSFVLHADTGDSDSDFITSDTTIDVTLNENAASWQYSMDGGVTWSASQASTVTTFELADNTTYQAGDLQIRQYDAAGNVSAVDSNSDQAVTTDSLVSEPELTFSLTSNELTSTTVTVTLADDVASWEYSLDGGATWNEGSGERFSLEPLTSYGANAIQVRQTDIAGNVSDTAINESLETDVAIDPPSFELASDTGVSDEDFITSATTVNVILLEGDEGAVSWNYSLDGGETWSADQGISTTSFELMGNTTYDIGRIVVTQTDAEGNTSAYAVNDDTVIIDSLVDAPEFDLNADTGSSASDGITNYLVINVDPAEDVATWQYSLDNGANWLDGEATSFELDANTTYGAGSIQVKQTDLAGNESLVYQNSSAITTDTLPLDAPSFSLNSDSGSSAVDNITNDLLINVELSEDAVSWQYSTDTGLTWQEGTGTSFELAANTTYAVGDIQVQQLDAAGNVSASALNEATIEIDTSAITPTFALNLDSGLSDSDGVTNDVLVNFDSNGETSTQSWSYSLDAGETWAEGMGSSFSLADNTTYAIGDIQVKQVDAAGNESVVGSNDSEIVTDSIAPATPSFALHADTGDSDSDFITSDTTIDVTLSDDAVSWEYSLDSGVTWVVGSGTSFEMGTLQTYEIGQIQVRQLDLAGNVSVAASNEVVFESDSLPAPEVVLAEDTGLSDSDNITSSLIMNVTVDVNATSWQYSLDGGATWVDGEGSSFELDANTTYAAESIQVKQFDADDNESAIFSNDSDVTTDTESQLEGDIYLASDSSIDTVIAEGDDKHYDVERYRLGENGDFVVSWIKDDEDAGDTLLMVQRYNADGSEMSLPFAVSIPIESAEYHYYSIEDITPVGADGAVVITWVGETYNEDEDYYDETNLYFQMFDADGRPVGDFQQTTATDEWIRDSQIISLADTDQFIQSWTEDTADDTVAYLQLFDATTGEEGALLTFETSVVASVLPTGNNGEFIVLWNEVVSFEDASAIVKAQTYSSDGTPIGSTIVLNPEAGEYSDGMRLLGEDGAFIALMINEQDMTMSLQLVNDNGSLGARVDLSEFSDLVDLEVGIAVLNSDNDFAVTWIGVNEADEPVIYTQSFMADGTPQNDPIALPFEFDADKDYDLFIESVSAETDEGYFITADYYAETGEGDDFIAGGVYFVDGNDVTEIAVSEENDEWAYFDIRVLNDNKDVLIFKEGHDDETWEADSWVQIYNPDGTEKTEKIEFTGNINDVVWTQLNSDGDFFISWVEYNGYYDDDSASWVNETTHHLQMFNADGTSITPIDIEQGDDLPVSVAEAGAAYLVSLSDSASITTLSDILALEEGSWSSVEVGADTDHALSTDGLPAGQYVVYATDVAGNITLNTTVVTISTELLAEPDVELNEDTGTYDDDEITNDTQVNVTLTDDAVRWEYSLDHGSTWTEGEGTSFNLTENTTFNYYDIQIRQYDTDGNVSEIATNSDGYVVTDNIISDPQIEVVGNSVLVTLDDDQNEWYYSLVGGGEDENNWTQGVGDSFTLAPNTTYNAGDIVVYVEDIASNEAEFVYQQQVVTGDAYEAPSFELFEDSGFSDSDGVTSEGSLNVQLSDDAVAFEYSLNGGETWQFGSGAYVLLGEVEFAISDFEAYQYDAEGNESELILDYGDDEYVDFAIGFDLLEDTVRWNYSIDGGETFTEVAWADADGRFIDLDYDEEYAIDDIQVRQIRSTGEVSAIATNDQVIITDEDSPYDRVLASNESPYDDIIEESGFDKLDGGLGDATVASLDEQRSIQLGDTGTYVSMWYLNSESEDVNSQLVVQMLDANGEPTSDYMRIEHENITEYLDLMAAIPLADTGSFVVTWEQYDDESDISDYYYQIFDENGAVGDLQSLENYVGYYGQFTDSFILPVGSEGNFVVTDNYYDEDQSVRMLTATLMNADGEVIVEITNSDDTGDEYQAHVKAVGEDGSFIVVGKKDVQLYSAAGEAIGESLPTLQDSPSNYFEYEGAVAIGDTGSYVVVTSAYQYDSYVDDDNYERYPVVFAQVFTAEGAYQGESIEIATGGLNLGMHHSRSAVEWIGGDKVVVVWTERDRETGGPGSNITYLQTINTSDGTLSGEAIAPFESIGEEEEISVRIADIMPVGEQGAYVLSGRVEYADSGDREYYAKFVTADGDVVNLDDVGLSADSNPRFTVESVGDEGAFVVAWNQTNQDGWGVSVQLYNVDGEAMGDTVLLEADPFGSFDRTPSIIELSGGEYIVTWIGDTYDDSETFIDVYSQKFNADGTLANQSTVYSDGDIPVESNEDGFAYLVNSSLFASDFLSDYDQWYDGLFDTVLNADPSYWNSVEVTAGVETSVSTDGLEGGTYYMLVTDLAGNVNVNDVGIVVAETVVFDLTTGESTDLDGRVFDVDETYDIYINVGDGSSLTLNEGEGWSGADNLGGDDRITLVSDDTVTSFTADTVDNIVWTTADNTVTLNSDGEFTIAAETADLWENAWASNPDLGLSLSQVTATETPDV